MWQYNHTNELYHWGVKGMKWGVRRYQNKDGTLTPAGQKRYSKEMYKDIEKAGRQIRRRRYGSDDTDVVKDKIRGLVAKADYEKLDALTKERKAIAKKLTSDEKKLDEYATIIGKKIYDEEMQKNGDAYPTERDKRKLWEYSVYDDGYTQARREHPELLKSEKDFDSSYDRYMEACKNIASRFTGEYGDRTVKSLSDSYNKKTVNDVVAKAVESLHYERLYKTK